MIKYKNLVLIDDDQDDLDFFIEGVSSLDSSIKCTTYTNSLSVQNLLVAQELPAPDIFFLDLNMPLLNGKQLLQKIKELQKYADIPVIIYTTSSSHEDKVETRRLGATHFITKPYTIKELTQRLKLILSHDWSKKDLLDFMIH
jgi:DNA-binding response OmpR family regulator